MRAFGAAALCLGLGGCFISPTPLITPEQAEFPVATPTTIDSIRADGTSVKLRLERQGDIYVLIDPDPKADGAPSPPEVKHRFVARGIGDGLFVIQRLQDKGGFDCPCTFGLAAMKGRRVEVYDFENFGSSAQLSAEEIARYGLAVEDTSYRVSSFEKTADLFRLLLERPRPDNIYEIK
jgi:hypothetical protein